MAEWPHAYRLLTIEIYSLHIASASSSSMLDSLAFSSSFTMFCTASALFDRSKLDTVESGTLSKRQVHIGLHAFHRGEPVRGACVLGLGHGEEALRVLEEVEAGLEVHFDL